MITKIYNGKVITPYRIIENGCVLIKDDVITYVGAHDESMTADKTIDAGHRTISPGFIDIHVHGGGGSDFMDGEKEDFIIACETHAKYGTTSIVPTCTSSHISDLEKSVKAYEQAKKMNHKGARMLGLHLEGPYFAYEQRGAQDPRYLRDPEKSEYEQIMSWSDDIIRWSLAPELNNAMEFAMAMKEKGIIPAIGHSDATYDQVLQAYEWGYELVTHLYSGCSVMRRINAFRVAGVVESAFLIDGMFVEVIADGCHLPASLLKLIYQNKGCSKIALITDGTRASGDSSVKTIVGSKKDGIKAIVEDGVAKLPDRSAFAGSVATTDRLVRTVIDIAEIPLTKAVEMMSATPAKIMKVYDKTGSLSPGKLADIILFDEDINVSMTMIEGNIVFEK
ncbi:MAG: N-acetylglucosamine-6-phosphate deacetylase [Clostridia bacterium]|nr:N-acetylglucosamine-6-phosphate deacetylase [Clostridia bacterium]